MILGGHVSVAGGIEKSVERAAREGFNAIQIFSSPPRAFTPNVYTDEQIDEFRRLYTQCNMRFLVQHAIYLVNLSSKSDESWQRGIQSIIGYMELGDRIGSVGTIIHVGTKSGEASLYRAGDAILRILDSTPPSQRFIIENAASSARIGSSTQDILTLLEYTKSDRVKVCIDTQHLFASGVDIREAEQVAKWVEEFDREIGVDQIICLHINDSKAKCGSGIDRHENISEGHIGPNGMREFLTHPKLASIPMILEVPGYDPQHKGPDRVNKERLEGILNSQTKKGQGSPTPLPVNVYQ